MKIHEYQAKGILKKYGVAVPRGTMARSLGLAAKMSVPEIQLAT